MHPESGFKVFAPYQLTHKTITVPTVGEPIIYTQYQGGSVQDSLHQLSLVIDHYQLTDQEIGSDDAHLKDFFETTVDEVLTSINGSLDYMDVISHFDRDVCIWRGSYLGGKGIVRGQLTIAGNKYYGMQVFGLTDKKPDEMMHKIIDSFQLINFSKQ